MQREQDRTQAGNVPPVSEFAAETAELLDIAPIQIWIADADCQQILGNRLAYQAHGLRPGANASFDAAQPEAPSVFRLERDGRELRSDEMPMQIAARTGRPVRNDVHDIVYADGTRRTMQANVEPLLDEHGRVRRVIGVYRDITIERQQAHALKESQSRLRAALDASTTGTFRWDILTNALDWDAALDRLFGLEPGETPRTLAQFLTLVHPDDRDGVIAACSRCASDGADFSMEFRVVRPDGTVRWLYDQGKTFRDDRNRPAYMTGACLDITHLRHVQDALRQSEARFRAAVQAVDGIIWTNDRHGKMRGEQPAWAALTGQTYDEYQGYGWSAAVHPDDIQPTIDRWERAVEERRTFVHEHRVRCADGAWRRFAIRAIPVIDACGEVEEWVGVHTDVTAEREVALALQEREARLSLALDAACLGAWELDPAAGTNVWDGQMGLLLGVPAHQAHVFAHAWEQFVHPDDYPRVAAALAACRQGASFQEEFRVRRLDGQARIFLSRGECVPSGKLIGIVQDVTDARRAEQALRESEKRLRLATEGAGVGTWELDLRTGIGRCSREAATLLGVDWTEYRVEEWLARVHPDDHHRGREIWENAVRDGATFEIEYRVLAGDHGPRWVVSRGKVESDASAIPVRASGVLIDVTARRVAEDELRLHQRELSRLVEERTAELLRSADERRRAEETARHGEKLAALGQLTGGVAHDFNNILQVVSSGVALLRKSDMDPLRRDVIVDEIKRACQTAREMTDRLLAFARQQPLKPKSFFVNERIEAFSSLLRQGLGEHISLTLALDPTVTLIFCDPGQLEVSLLNLVSNARAAMPNGGDIAIRSRSASLPGKTGEYVCLEVSDTGAGMSPAVLRRAMEPFFTTKGPGLGTGLGLPQVQGFAHQSDGEVQLESTEGRGTVVRLYLPSGRSADVSVQREGAQAGAPDLKQKRVLIVEDNAQAADFATELLEEMGIKTQLAANGTQAKKILEQGVDVDLVFSDVVMPGEPDGVQLAAWLRCQKPSIGVVLASGYSARLGEIPDGVELLRKPYRLDQLIAALGRAAQLQSAVNLAG